MGKNCMEGVAKLLGVELGEEFIIENQDRKETVVVSLDGFHVIQPNNVLGPDHGKLLSKVLQGLYEVKKKPWEPKKHEIYFYPSTSTKCVESTIWYGGTCCFALKILGMIYRTEKEAMAHYAEDYQKLTGKPLTSAE